MIHIAFATDLSELSARAARHIAPLVRAIAHGRCIVDVIHVPERPVGRPVDVEGLEADLTSLCERELRDLEWRIGVLTDKKPIVEAIEEFVTAMNARLLVMATHGRTGIAKALFGSTAEALARHARFPLVICPATVREPRPEHEGTHVAMLTDGGDSADVMSPFAAKLLAGLGSQECRLTIVHVLAKATRATFDVGLGESPDVINADFERRAGVRLDEIRRRYFSDTVAMSTVVTADQSIEEAACRYLRTHDADFVLVSPRRKGAADRAVFGSMTTHLLQHSPCPIITLPAR